MVEFSRYYIDFILELLSNIGSFFKSVFKAFADFFFNDVKSYMNDLIDTSKNFTMLDWVVAAIVLIINLAFITFLVIKLYQWLRRYIRFTHREVEKDELLEEISILNMKTAELVEEKNKILAMKVSQLGLQPDRFQEDYEAEEEESTPDIGESRFVKLSEVDEEYRGRIPTVIMEPEDMIGLQELVERFVNFSASQLNLYYSKKIISAFFAGLATSKIMILEGISGTGKTSLPYAMGKFFNNGAAIVSVQPAWRDRAELFGYLNEFTKKFNESDFLRHVYEATYREDICLIILDEMNLARIEYYFAEFLSILEMPNSDEWKIEVVPNEQPNDPKNLIGGKLTIPQNLWFIGTANRDDSTFTITDKVYDRAATIEMNVKAPYIDAPPTKAVTISFEYLDNLFNKAEKEYPLSPKMIDSLNRLDVFITSKFKVTFGNRIMKQIRRFVPVFVACGRSEVEGLDFMVARKILRKFEALNLAFLQEEIDQLTDLMDRLFGKDMFEESKLYLEELKRSY
ncbi:MAG: hypothetical protein M0R05_02000 [Bacilli bacterium]|nr:hypothetical protein [Bacilli bacterium]MDD4076833.1 hypothetical protein [Bacilli bacterium]MDD4388251.1 hypothetical protein [Bacilli bacterium]